ncbi:MAG: transaldolase family protein [bacterium]|nr:transaldolase family protein [bacterium]
MVKDSYLQWLVKEIKTTWWHDSGDPDELQQALLHGATGVTTNPVLISKTLHSSPEKWNHLLKDIKKDLSSQEQAEFLVSVVVKNAAKMFKPEYERTSGKLGYVCAQVNPAIARDTEAMISMARRFHSWAPNIAVKFPVTAAGLDALEECASEGITITATVSFTVPQVIAVAERFRKGKQRAQQAGKIPGQCFAVIMIGRLDDYLRDMANDSKANINESDIRQAGLAVTKRAYSIFKKHDYEATLVVAALRGTYHMEELTGAELIMSIHPKYQTLLLQPGIPRDPQRIDVSIDSEVINRLETIPEFVRAYEPEGMKPEEFVTYGAAQRTLTQFSQAGWMQLEEYRI